MSRARKETFNAGSTGHAPASVPTPAAARPPATAAELRARTARLAPTLAPAVRAVAEALAADPAGCARLTVTALAERTGTSEATVVRTARLLGYPGYRDLRPALAELAGRAARGSRRGAAPGPPDGGREDARGSAAITTDIAVGDPLADVVAKLAHAERRALADTAAGLDLAELAAAVAALAGARRIDVYGVGASALVAQDLAQKLLRIGLIAHAHADPHLALTSAVQLGPGDAAVAVTRSGTTADVVGPLRTAFERGATTVAITEDPHAPVTYCADHVLTTAATPTGPAAPPSPQDGFRPAAMSGRTSQLLLVDCLFVGVAQRTYDTAAPALAASHRALAPRHRAPAPTPPSTPAPARTPASTP
ncbi:MurR/RpiR family transcriptional regulator, partial [Streptomyces sp. NRRL S-87]|uniref:MurR/RpiR family transcriptional regulator n=1 Tax=Streptomyces sp. NRRL S-87 TaxID=1463920 RepID=UPI0007C51109